MSFTALCPFCNANYAGIDDNHRGHKGRCKRCGQSFLAIPNTDAAQQARDSARRLKVPFVRVAAVPIDFELVAKLPRDVLTRLRAIPVGRTGDDLIVAMVEPGDILATDELRRHYPRIRTVLGLAAEIQEALNDLPSAADLQAAANAKELEKLGGNALAAQALQALERDATDATDDEPAQRDERRGLSGDDETADDTGKLVATILQRAIELQASELRIMDRDGEIIIQGRAPSGLEQIPPPADLTYRRLMARLKDAAGCDPVVRGEDQEGSIPFRTGGKEYEFGLKVMGVRGTDRATLRVMDASTMQQRRAMARRQQIDETFAVLSGNWPPPGVDATSATDFVADLMEGVNPAQKLVYAVLFHGLKHNAKHLVLEPYRGELRVLARSTEEHFEPIMMIPAHGKRALMARLQIMANIDLGYRKSTGLGVFYLLKNEPGRQLCYEIRVATIETDIGPVALVHLLKQA